MIGAVLRCKNQFQQLPKRPAQVLFHFTSKPTKYAPHHCSYLNSAYRTIGSRSSLCTPRTPLNLPKNLFSSVNTIQTFAEKLIDYYTKHGMDQRLAMAITKAGQSVFILLPTEIQDDHLNFQNSKTDKTREIIMKQLNRPEKQKTKDAVYISEIDHNQLVYIGSIRHNHECLKNATKQFIDELIQLNDSSLLSMSQLNLLLKLSPQLYGNFKSMVYSQCNSWPALRAPFLMDKVNAHFEIANKIIPNESSIISTRIDAVDEQFHKDLEILYTPYSLDSLLNKIMFWQNHMDVYILESLSSLDEYHAEKLFEKVDASFKQMQPTDSNATKLIVSDAEQKWRTAKQLKINKLNNVSYHDIPSDIKDIEFLQREN